MRLAIVLALLLLAPNAGAQCLGNKCSLPKLGSLAAAAQSPILGACVDGLDNDADGEIDYPTDDGCASAASSTESPVCDDGLDNDSDGDIDLADAGCATASEDSEIAAQCEDLVDNDADTFIDYPTDPGCNSISDDDEYTPGPLNGTVAAFTATPLQHATQCVAPCVVHFDAGATDDDAYTREFHEMTYRWNFNDTPSASQSWWHTAETGLNRNKDFGPIVGHVYETAGTYNPVLTVTAPDGGTDTETHAVVVADPQTVFGDALTWCFSTGTNFAGCPLDDDSDGACEAGESSYSTHCVGSVAANGFDEALKSNTATIGCNADGAKARCLFKGGDNFSSNAQVTLYRSSSPGLIGSFGTGRANVATTAATQFDLRDGWQVSGLAFDCGATNDCGIFTRSFPVVTIRNAGVYNTLITGRVSNCAAGYGEGGAGVSNADVWFVGNDCEKTNTTTSGGIWVFSFGSRQLFVGNRLNTDFYGISGYLMRLLLSDSSISHNELLTPGVDAFGSWTSAMQMRAGVDVGSGNTSPSTRNEVAYNHYSARNGHVTAPTPNGIDFSKICSHHSGCDAQTAEGATCSDIIYENNFHTIDGTPNVGVGAAMTAQCADTTIRNNIFDLQGSEGFASPSAGIQMLVLKNKPSNVASGDRVEMYSNTTYISSEAQNYGQCVIGSNLGTNHRCASNLAYLPSHGGTRTATNSASFTDTTPANDLRTTPIPSWWPGAVPAQGTTDYLDFLAASGTCDLTAIAPTNVGAQRGCIVQ